jgi:hypothetical protein
VVTDFCSAQPCGQRSTSHAYSTHPLTSLKVGHPYTQRAVYLSLSFLFEMRQRRVVGGSVDELEGTWTQTVVAVSPHSRGGKGKVVPVLNY